MLTAKKLTETATTINPYNASMDLEAGIYLIEISQYSGYTGTYNLRGEFNPAGNNEREPNNTRQTSQLVSSGQNVLGFISHQDKIDMYRYELAQPGRLTVNITRGAADGLQSAYIRWLDADGKEIKRDSSSINPYNGSMNLEAGSYLIEITPKPYSNFTGTYNLHGEFNPARNNEREPNNTRQTSQLLSSGQNVLGFISYQDTIDMYRYELAQPGRLTVNVTSGAAGGLQRAYIRWLDADGTEIKRKDDYGINSYNASMDLEAGIYLIEISQYSGYTGTYNLTIK